MTIQDEAVAPVQSDSSSVEAPYQTLDALRDAHSALRRSLSRASDAQGSAGREEQIRSFLVGACNAGLFLADAKERRVAQSIIDYWSAELSACLTDKPPELGSSLLAQSDPKRAPSGSDQLSTPATPKKGQRALIRLSAMARQWRDSGRQSGYLLTGVSLKEAAQFKDRDSDLAAFVEASRRAIIRRRFFWLTVGVVVTLIGGGTSLWCVTSMAQQLRDYKVRQAWMGANPVPALWWLDLLQPLSEPYDLSLFPQFNKVEYPKLRLYAPNFSGVPLRNVKFPAARLPAASFSGSEFSFDGDGSNDFSAAVLRQAQFRGAKIAKTSFAGADLYRASFDRAHLCDVDFTGANLRSASFGGVTFNAKTQETLKRTAWWQALGWSVEQIKDLTPASPAEEKQLKNTLKTSQGFQYDIKTPVEDIQRNSGVTVERAAALNSFAWTEAIWGIDISQQDQGNIQANDAAAADSCVTSGSPKHADEAALQAVCIATQLYGGGTRKDYAALLSNLRDTLAYIFLQNNKPEKALEQYRAIENDNASFLQDPETSFRYAIALYAGSKDPDKDKPAAIKQFAEALQKGRYQPTHELHTLNRYIFTVKEFTDTVETTSNQLWTTVKSLPRCQ